MCRQAGCARRPDSLLGCLEMTEETLTGSIERVTFHNPDNGFCVLRVAVEGRPELVTVIGTGATVNVGELIQAEGHWMSDHRGLQFKARSLRCLPPHSREGIERFLASGMVKGIGPEYAKRIVQAFGERTLEVIDRSPAFLREVKGIGEKRLALIRQSWNEQKGVRDLMIFLQSHGMGGARAMRIHRTYGDQAIALIRANPYRLAADIWGVGFHTADELARKLGIAPDAPERARAALLHALRELGNDGHVGFPEDAVADKVVELTSIPTLKAREAIEAERQTGAVVRENRFNPPWLYLKPLYLAESNLAQRLASFLRGKAVIPEANQATIASVERHMKIELAPEQREALRQCTIGKTLIITGGPGVGKTTLVRGIVELYSRAGKKVELCAPTGRAAKRLQETTGRDARTLHRLLEFDPHLGVFKRDPANRLEGDLFLADEASMLDLQLAWNFIRALPEHASLVLVGDVDQLPSVGPGRVLADLINCRMIPVVRLTRVFRQAAESGIVRAAHEILQGRMPHDDPPAPDFFFVETDEAPAIADKIVTLVSERIPRKFGFDPLRDIQVLSPMNRTELGVTQLNAKLQAALNPDRGQPRLERFGQCFRAGDRVLQTANNYKKQVFNGDLGRIEAIDPDERVVRARFDTKEVEYEFGEMDELQLAYATSIHKSQGSEYPAVVIPLHTQHFLMLERNLLYTGVTRGKKLVCLVGSRRALHLAVTRTDDRERCSALGLRLRDEMEGTSGEAWSESRHTEE
ncbi:MAG: ATP-dependent RecD-like DNA helicase [Planctomycetota bacterium]|nr:MAG: ATP-dependent RecD-like DNA helicase [Planctomycetota bacterium]